tara:strand:- start:448 stop:663 length:216 start_codon:yes stop_codon:yes gene_type:complete
MKKIKESKQNLTEGLMDIIWKKLMKGKKADIINAFDNNSEVKQSLDNFAKANQDLKDTLERIRKEMGKTKK